MNYAAVESGNFEKQTVLSYAEDLARGYRTMAQAFYHYHVSGFADYGATLLHISEEAQQTLDTFINRIEDEELRGAFIKLTENWKEMVELDARIVEWVANYVGLPLRNGKLDRASLIRHLRRIAMNRSGGCYQGPVWALQPGYQMLVRESENIVSSINIIQQQISCRIRLLFEESAAT